MSLFLYANFERMKASQNDQGEKPREQTTKKFTKKIYF